MRKYSFCFFIFDFDNLKRCLMPLMLFLEIINKLMYLLEFTSVEKGKTTIFVNDTKTMIFMKANIYT